MGYILKKNIKAVGIAAATLNFLAGCALNDFATNNPLDDRATLAGSNPVVDTEDFAPVDLVLLLDPEEKWKSFRVGSNATTDTVSESAKIELAFKAFYKYPGDLKLRRDRVQERILAASQQRCEIFKKYVHRLRSNSNFLTGLAATATGVLGGLFTAPATARSLSAASGIITGARAEFNQEMFANLATNLITAGVNKRRQEVYEQIVLRGQVKPIEEYNVENAVGDAVLFDGMCSTHTAFEVATKSIKTTVDPGIDAANRMLAKLSATRKLLQLDIMPKEARELAGSVQGELFAGRPDTSASKSKAPSPAGRFAELKTEVAAARDRALTAMVDKKGAVVVAAKEAAVKTAADLLVVNALKQLDTCKTSAQDTEIALLTVGPKLLVETDAIKKFSLERDQKVMTAEAELLVQQMESIQAKPVATLNAVEKAFTEAEKITNDVLDGQAAALAKVNGQTPSVAFGKCT